LQPGRESTHLLALPEGLVEALAEADVALGLSTLDEVLDLPSTGAWNKKFNSYTVPDTWL
jgi:hypothetical protein